MPVSNQRYKPNRLQQLRGFCYAARSQSISKAAERLGMSQPSVSLQIEALEQELGAQLFQRRGPRIALTHIAQYPLILPPKNLSTQSVVEAVFAEHKLDHDVKLEVGGYDVIKRYVELGLGISVVMSH